MYLLLGIVIISYACQTNTELTDADKDAMVQAVKKASQDYWSIVSSTYDSETYNKRIKFFDESSDQMWQTEPVSRILNTTITSKQADVIDAYKSMTENRISVQIIIQRANYSVLSDKKVLEVIVGDGTGISKDSSVIGPSKFVNTAIWANIDGEWKMQFTHQSSEID